MAIQEFGEGYVFKNLQKSTKPDEAWKITFVKPKGAACYVNQYNGTVISKCDRLAFFTNTQALHRWLLDKPKDGKSLGKSIIGWCVLASLIILLSGLAIWWPKSMKILKIRLKIKTSSVFAFWYTFHITAGAYTCLILLIIILTGLSWSFPIWKEALISIFGQVPFKMIHTGAWLGLAGKILWFVTLIVGVSLPLSGYYIWLKSTFKKNRSVNTTPSKLFD